MRKIILLLAAGLLLLAGCSNIVQQENDTDSSSGGAAGAFLRVTAETEGFGARKEEASARTALPTIDESAVTDLFTYTLKGTKEGGSEETLVSGVSLAKLKESQIPVTTGKWSFTLTAEKDGTVFTGTLSDKTITAGDNELSFTISWDESSLSGKGSLAFSLDWSKAGLNSVEAAAGTLFAYDPKTGTETETDYTESSGGITLDKDAHTVTYSLSDVPAGVYMIKISFYSDAEKTNLAGTWRELAVITGGQKSGASRVMDVFVKHAATIDPIKDGGLSGITQKTSSVEGIVTLAENTDGTYTLTSQGMGTSVLTFNGTNADGQSVAVTYNVSVSDTGELTVGSPKVVYSVTVAGGIEHGTVTAKPAPAAAGETVTLTVTPESGYAGAIAIKNASGEDISSSVSLSQDSEDTKKWTFTMPKDTVTVSAIFEDTEPFTTTLKQGRGLYGDGINGILTYRLSSSAKQFKKSSTRNVSATEYLDINKKIPVWYDSSSETIYYYIPASCTSVKMNEDSSNMFYGMQYLTSIEINDFDTSAVTNMWAMFEGCTALKSLDLSSFDTSAVTSMCGMFYNCWALESLDLGDSFDTSKVTSMENMFANCRALESSDLSSFIDTIDTSSVTDMRQMFAGCTALESLDLRSFNTSKVTTMEAMFASCTALTSLDLSSFNTSSVTDMSCMFENCTVLESLDLRSFNTSSVTDMHRMFVKCTALESLDLNSFDTSNVTTMESMFENCTSLKSLDLSSFNTSSVTNMYVMFSNCTSLKSLDLSSFDTSKVTAMGSIFRGCSSLKTIYASDTFVTTNVNINYYTGQYCFSGCTSLVGGSGTTYDEYKIDATYARIDGGPDSASPGYFTVTQASPLNLNLKTGVAIHSILVQLCKGSGDYPACTKFARSATNNASATLYLDTEEKYIPVWLVGTEVYYYVPDGCTPVMNEDSSGMFMSCSGLTSLDLDGFDTSNVTDMYDMFSGCSGLTSLDLSSFDTSKVKDMADMFSGCSGLTSLDLSSFDTSDVTDMSGMFSGCIELRTIYATGKFVTTSVTDGGLYCFDQCSKLVGGAGTIFDASDNGKTLAVPYARIDGGTDAPGYFTAKATAIGIKSKPDAVGDIVFSDGSATPYTADLTLTEEQKAKAVAVIFYAGSASDTLGAKTLGVGLKNATGNGNTLAWARYTSNTDKAEGYSTDITTIQCTPIVDEEGAVATVKFTGDTDGSDNWQALCAAVDDESTIGNYPAWEWVNAYATENLPEGSYASGWYLPTVAELSMLYRVKGTVNSALEKAGGTKIDDVFYWSSSQVASYGSSALGVRFDDGLLDASDKSIDKSVCTVRAF